jgi:tight adherence protein C
MSDPLLLSACAFLMLLILISGVGYRVFYKPGKFLKQLGGPVITDSARRTVIQANPEGGKGSGVTDLLKRLGSKVPSSDAEIANLRTDLMQAGYRSETAAPIFFGLRITAAFVMFILSFLLQSKLPPNPALKLAMMGFGVCAGWILPRFVLEKKTAKRQETLKLSLPDALDMMVVSVEAGLGLDQTIQHIARELQFAHPELADELSLVVLEMRAGKRRADALRNLAERTGEPEIGKLVAILIQNDRFGTSMGESLRTHSDHMRVKRRQEAEERAGKVGVKLVFPIFFFILPSMMVVAAGPGLLQVFKYLFPLMKQMGNQ